MAAKATPHLYSLFCKRGLDIYNYLSQPPPPPPYLCHPQACSTVEDCNNEESTGPTLAYMGEPALEGYTGWAIYCRLYIHLIYGNVLVKQIFRPIKRQQILNIPTKD